MNIVRNNLYGVLNENMQQARAILKKYGVNEKDDRFQKLKEMLAKDNKFSYIGQFTKWLIEKHDSIEEIQRVYNLMKNYKKGLPALNTFETSEKLFDYLVKANIENDTNTIISDGVKGSLKKFVSDDLKTLIKGNVIHKDAIMNFLQRNAVKYQSKDKLYQATKDFVDNLNGDFNMENYLALIKDNKLNVEIKEQTDNILALKINDFRASKILGKGSEWCITREEHYFHNYGDMFHYVYMIFDFSKPFSDIRSMIAIIIGEGQNGKETKYREIEWKNNTHEPVKVEGSNKFISIYDYIDTLTE